MSTKYTAGTGHLSTKFTDGEASAKVMCKRSSQPARLQQSFSQASAKVTCQRSSQMARLQRGSARNQQSFSQASEIQQKTNAKER